MGLDPEAVSKRIGADVTAFAESPSVLQEPLLQPKAVARFYNARGSRPAWIETGKIQEILESIRSVERDGLTPSDYHLATIEKSLDRLKAEPSASLQGDLDVLLTDAVAGILDHVQYGRVRPVRVNPNWNVDPRDGAPPLQDEIASAAGSPSLKDAIEKAKPDHFIYHGLERALADLRAIQAHGGWPQVSAGPTLRQGSRDPRVHAVRARLEASGELRTHSTSSVYDAELKRAVALFQERHRLDATGVLDAATVHEMNVSVDARIGQVRVNLERARWVLGKLGPDFLLVNLPAFKAYLIRGSRNVWEARTQIGEEAMQTPTFRDTVTTVVFNPDWTVPPTILADEVIEPMSRGEDVLTKKGLGVVNANNEPVDPSSIDWGSASADQFPYTVRQPPGPDNPLGRVKFLFPNKYSIYLHDTPSQHLFESNQRTFSHGCIRVENALDLAQILLGGQDSWGPAKIQEVLATSETQNVALERQIPILIVYWTVTVGASGEVKYARDIYNLDAPLLRALVKG